MDFWKDVTFQVTDAPAAGGGSLGVAPGATPIGAAGSAVSGVAGSPSPAGGFRMSRDEMDSTRQKAEALRDKIRAQLIPARRLTTMQSPADEPVSNGVTTTLNNAGEYYVGHLQRQEAYLDVVIDKMRQALGMVSLAEEHNQGMIEQAGGGSIE